MRRGRRPSLALDRIAAVTVEIADVEELAAVSMPRVAERLGVSKMALYRYVTAKADLLAVAVDAAQADPPALTDAGEGWRPRLEWWARFRHEVWRRHPWLPAAVPGGRVLGPNELGWIDRATAVLEATGLDGAQRLDAVLLLAATAAPRRDGECASGFGVQVVLDGLAAAIRAADTVYDGNGSTAPVEERERDRRGTGRRGSGRDRRTALG
jgi:AcrR family transcriptional regulator